MSVAPAVSTAPAVDRERVSLGRSSVVSFAGSAVSALLGFSLVVVLARLTGAADAGIVLQAIAVFMIALGFARFGMDSTAVWLLPRLVDDRPDQVRATAWFLICGSGVAGLLSTAAVLIWCGYFGAREPGSPLPVAVRLSAAFLPAAAMLLTALAVSRALGGITQYVLIGGVGLPAARLLAVASAALLGFGATGIVLAWAAPAILALGIALAAVAWQVRMLARSYSVAVAETRSSGSFFGSGLPTQTLGFAAPRVISAALEQMLLWISVLVVGSLAGAAAAGIYGAASRFIAAGMIVESAIRVVVAPAFSRLLHRDELAAVRELHRTATSWLVLFGTPIFVLIAIFAPVVLSVLGPEFVSGAPVLAVMCLGALVAFLAGNVQTILLTAGRSGLAALNKAVVVIVHVALIMLLMQQWGVLGAAWAWTVACCLDALLAWCEIRWVLGLEISPTAGFYALGGALLAVGLPALMARLFLGATWLGLAAALAVGGALFVALYRFGRFRTGAPG